MLTVKAPLEIKAKTSYLRDPESFYHRIIGNYSLVETRVDEEDLLHITTTPPEIYVTEGEGISSIFNNSVRNENNYNKVEILNNVLNRIVASADMKLTYQDRVFITDALYRLGVRDDRKFMNAFYRMAQETKNTNSLINLYLEQGEDIRSLVEIVQENSALREKTEGIHISEQETENHLYNNVFKRLQTGAVYQIVSNFNRSSEYNEIERNEYSLSEQSYTAQNILLSMMRERAHVGQQNLFLINDNTYEEDLESVSSEVTNVKNEINGAVLMQLLQNIYRTGFEKFFLDQNTFFKFEDTFYKASDQIVSKLVSNFGTSVSRNDVTNVLNEVKNGQVINELQLFAYSQQNEISPDQVQNIEDIINQIAFNNEVLNKNLSEYNSRTNSYSFEIIEKGKKALPMEVLESLRIVGEEASSEIIQNISNRIIEAVKTQGNVFEIISEYTKEIEKSRNIRAEQGQYVARTELIGMPASYEREKERTGETEGGFKYEKLGKLLSEIQFVDNSQQNVFDSYGIEILEEILNQIEVSRNEFSENISEFNSQATSYSLELAEKVRKALPTEIIEQLSLIGEEAGNELVQNIYNRVAETAIARGKDLEIISEYKNEIERVKTVVTEAGRSEIRTELINRPVSYEGYENGPQTPEESAEHGRAITGNAEAISILNRYLSYVEVNRDNTTVIENPEHATEMVQLISLLEEGESGEFTISNLEKLKEIIRSSTEIVGKDKTKYLSTITENQIKLLKELQVPAGKLRAARKDLITLLSENNKVRISEKTNTRIRELISQLGNLPQKLSVIYREGDVLTVKEQSPEETKGKGAAGKMKIPPAELIFESPAETEEEENPQNLLVINRDEFTKLLRTTVEKELPAQAPVSSGREIIREIGELGEKVRAGYTEGGQGYEAYKDYGKEELVEAPEEGSEEGETELITEKTTQRITDEDIRKLTENVNKLELLNEEKRKKYLETIRNIKRTEEKVPSESAFAKTRKMAELSLSSPEKLMEKLTTERIVKEKKEKEFLSQLKEAFPEQSIEIYQLLNKYQTNPEEVIRENYFRNAEVGELIYDINSAMRGEEEPPKEGKPSSEDIQSSVATAKEPVPRGQVQGNVPHPIRPVETVHKINETLSSEEINEQLELMQHNLKKQIKEEVTSDVVTENRRTNAKEIRKMDTSTREMSQVNIQRMIDNTVRAEMNTISNQVISKLERQMRNEKIRRGY